MTEKFFIDTNILVYGWKPGIVWMWSGGAPHIPSVLWSIPNDYSAI